MIGIFHPPDYDSPKQHIMPRGRIADRCRKHRARHLVSEAAMNLEKVVFGFFIVLSLTLNFGFFLGEIDDATHHHAYELFAVIIVNLIATVLKFGDRSQMGAVLLSTSLVAVLQLLAAAMVWAIAVYGTGSGLTPTVMASIVSLSGGAMLANVISVTLLIIETVLLRR